jgi:hypothetical protein
MSVSLSTATEPEPSHQSSQADDCTQFRNDYAVARSDVVNSLLRSDDDPSKELVRKISRRLALMDKFVKRLTRHKSRKFGVLSAAIPLYELSDSLNWSVAQPIARADADQDSLETVKVDPAIVSYHALRDVLSQAWLEEYSDSVFETPRRLKEPSAISGPKLHNLTHGVLSVAGELFLSFMGQRSNLMNTDQLACEGRMHGHTFPSEFDVLNPRLEPGMMDYYLGTPKPRRSEGREAS